MGSSKIRTAVGAGALGVTLALASTGMTWAESRVVDATVRSAAFEHSRIGIRPERPVAIYLPDGYDSGQRRYPVVYYLHNLFEDQRSVFETHGGKAVLDRAMAEGAVGPFILVSADYSTPLGSSFYVNSATTGNWADFLVKELVPYVDRTYRTVPNRDARALLGDRVGGYGALRFAMTDSETFGVTYALHPVGTGFGVQSMGSRPDFERLAAAPTLEALNGHLFERIFTAIYQAFTPNPQRPPLYVDLPTTGPVGRTTTDAKVVARLEANFMLASLIPHHADDLKTLRGLKFDWGRQDTNFDHVHANQAFARRLEEYGVPHEAEEYRGYWGERHWAEDGRVVQDVLPFFARRLAGAQPPPSGGPRERPERGAQP